MLRLVLLLGTCIRVFLFALPSLHDVLSSRPELVTPISSFYRVQEGVFLYHITGSPYTGDVYHQSPLLFALLYPVLEFIPLFLQYAMKCTLFISIDILLAMGFARLCVNTLKLEEGRPYKIQQQDMWLTQVPVSPLFEPHILPTTVALIYLINPYSLSSCVAMSTISFTHFTVLYSLVFASEGALVASMMCLAIGTYLSVYPFFLMLPIALLLRSVETDKTGKDKASGIEALFGFKCLGIFGLWLSMLLHLSWSLNGDWTFVEETYVWVAKFSDLTPNIGIFWYFFTEVFDRFIPYFLFVMHLHPVIYIVPIYLRLAHRPQAYACALIGIFSLFQAYPSFGDFGFFLSMLAIHPKTIMTIKNRYIYVIGLGAATCMLPVMWFLWLFPASGNANFYYNQTLVYQMFSSQIINAFVGATMKRDKDVDKYRASFLKNNEKTNVEARQ